MQQEQLEGTSVARRATLCDVQRMRELNAQRLRYFEEILTRGSIRSAADALNTAPSVILRQLRLLEEEVGSKLFHKHARGMTPTAAAAEVQDYARACRAQREALQERLDNTRELRSGEVRLAMSEGFVDEFTDEVLIPFRRRFPRISLVANVNSVKQIVTGLLDETAHIGIAYSPPAVAQIVCYASCPLPLTPLMSARHPLAKAGKPITLRAALGYPVALMPSEYGIGKAIELACYEDGVVFAPVLVSNSFHLLRRFLRDDEGVIFGSISSVRQEASSGEVVSVPLRSRLLAAGRSRVLVKAGRPFSRATTEMLGFIMAMSRGFIRHQAE